MAILSIERVAAGRGLMLMIICMLQALFAGEAGGQELHLVLSSSDGQPVSGAIVEVIMPDSLAAQYQQPHRAVVDQVDKEFLPTTTTIVVGSEVSFPNSDDILHHVYSFSAAKTFNIPLYGKGENDDYFETFPKPGIVEIGCNIHDWMLAYIYVGESTLMAVSDEAGELRLADLPVGEFQIKLWHDRLDAEGNTTLHQIQLREGATTRLELNLELERDRRLRRAPSANRSRYR